MYQTWIVPYSTNWPVFHQNCHLMVVLILLNIPNSVQYSRKRVLGHVISCLESKFEKRIPMGSVPNERKEILMHDPIRWFKCKLKPPKNKKTLLEITYGYTSVPIYGSKFQNLGAQKNSTKILKNGTFGLVSQAKWYVSFRGHNCHWKYTLKWLLNLKQM